MPSGKTGALENRSLCFSGMDTEWNSYFLDLSCCTMRFSLDGVALGPDRNLVRMYVVDTTHQEGIARRLRESARMARPHRFHLPIQHCGRTTILSSRIPRPRLELGPRRC